MKKQIFILVVVFLYETGSLHAQWYINLSVDNDLFFGRDRYYSSGIFISSGKLNKSSDTLINYVHWTLGHEIYTPSLRYSKDIEYYDYPYGGWLFFQRAEERQLNLTNAWLWSIKAGVTGKASLAQLLQNLYHDKILGLPNMAWEKPVPQRFHVNLSGLYKKRINIFSKTAILTDFFGNLGTQRTAIGSNIGILLGSTKVISFIHNPLEMQEVGFGFYIGSRFEYRFHDFMISGSLFDDNAPFTLDPIPFKYNALVGLAFYGKQWQLQMLFNRATKDNTSQKIKGHNYLNISLSRLF